MSLPLHCLQCMTNERFTARCFAPPRLQQLELSYTKLEPKGEKNKSKDTYTLFICFECKSINVQLNAADCSLERACWHLSQWESAASFLHQLPFPSANLLEWVCDDCGWVCWHCSQTGIGGMIASFWQQSSFAVQSTWVGMLLRLYSAYSSLTLCQATSSCVYHLYIFPKSKVTLCSLGPIFASQSWSGVEGEHLTRIPKT